MQPAAELATSASSGGRTHTGMGRAVPPSPAPLRGRAPDGSDLRHIAGAPSHRARTRPPTRPPTHPPMPFSTAHSSSTVDSMRCWSWDTCRQGGGGQRVGGDEGRRREVRLSEFGAGGGSGQGQHGAME